MLVVIEGLDGSGKTTLIQKLQESLKDSELTIRALESVNTSTVLGKRIREILANPASDLQDVKYLFLIENMMVLNRMKEESKDCKHCLFLKDRLLPSTIAYGENANTPEFIELLKTLFAPYKQDIIYVFISTGPEECFARLKRLSRKLDKYENISNLRKVYNIYEQVFNTASKDANGVSYCKLDGNPVFSIDNSMISFDYAEQLEKIIVFIRSQIYAKAHERAMGNK